MSPTPLRCAIYTRKSTEAGLEQEFNSLDAQREACLAYIKSQKHEGWSAIATEYDDGGFSGGSMERPALKRLMTDIAAGKVNIIVVYKVDRLTRSLADFAKIIEVLDGHKASFVSVTQQFNTTSSMGRLTLNVLLSFAQFEREVTSERIRDKIAASKKKGLWMGGMPPLGYDVSDRKLVVNKTEAEQVRLIYRNYLELGTVEKLLKRMSDLGIKSKSWTTQDGRVRSGGRFSKTGIHYLLKCVAYIGKIPHKGQVYLGNHESIVPLETWTAVQERLKSQWGVRKASANQKSGCWLVGLMFDEHGQRFTNVATTKAGRKYRYYVTGTKTETARGTGWRLPAKDIERIVVEAIRTTLQNPSQLLDLLSDETGPNVFQIRHAAQIAQQRDNVGEIKSVLRRVELRQQDIVMTLSVAAVRHLLDLPGSSEDTVRTTSIPVQLKRRGVEARLVLNAPFDVAQNADPTLARLVARAHVWFEQLKTGEHASIDAIAQCERMHAGEVSRALPLAFLAPSLVTKILKGQQPLELTAEHLRRLSTLPPDWAEQRKVLGI